MSQKENYLLNRKLNSLKKRMRNGFDSFLLFMTNHVISRTFFSILRLCWYRRVMGFKIGKESSILTGLRVSGNRNLDIGENTIINNECRLDNRNNISLGNNVSISYGTIILTMGHDIDDPGFKHKGAAVVVEDYVWLCAKSMIMPGVKISKGAVILPGSVVTKDVSAYTVVGGNPAEKIRERNKELDYKLKWNPRVPPLG